MRAPGSFDRYERDPEIHLAFLTLACSILCWRRLPPTFPERFEIEKSIRCGARLTGYPSCEEAGPLSPK